MNVSGRAISDKAAQRLLEIANTIEPEAGGRIYVEKVISYSCAKAAGLRITVPASSS
jgi:hypothetical protein